MFAEHFMSVRTIHSKNELRLAPHELRLRRMKPLIRHLRCHLLPEEKACRAASLLAAARSNRSLSEQLNVQEANRAAESLVLDRLTSLAAEQTEPKKFYSYDTLRGMGINGRHDIAPCVAKLNDRGITVVFPNGPRRSNDDKGKNKRGLLLYKQDRTQE